MSAAKSTLTAERLREVLRYDPETGLWQWRTTIAKRARAGSPAGTLKRSGYVRINIFGVAYPSHRLAWLYVYGRWPSQTIDHINGNRADNRICNLRDVPMRINIQNKRKPVCTNRTGFLGIRRDPTSIARWSAKIVVDGKAVFLGQFPSPEDAHQAYLKAKRILHEGCTI